jgi:hypothetical protein
MRISCDLSSEEIDLIAHLRGSATHASFARREATQEDALPGKMSWSGGYIFRLDEDRLAIARGAGQLGAGSLSPLGKGD